ncbi:unnamed protein product [Calicophoron daubneyi]|uniref:Uncharacterized protein n=1 Tax=Calicophoron daubneyi TaxID=300641 RepID=A0AAV2TQZ0_CALDB
MSQAGVHTSNRPQSAARLSAASAAKRSPSPARGPSSEAGFSVASSAKSAKSASRNKQRASTYPRKGTTLGDIVLSPEEQQHLEDVLARFDRAKQAEDFRLKSLKDELIKKQKNRIRNAETGGGDGHCYNCGRLFIPLFNAANECYICNHEFCRTCVEKMPNSKNVMCKFCHSESIYRGQLGIWFMEELKVARAEGRVRGVSGPEALRSSLLRIKRQSKADSVLQQGLDGLSLEHRIISDPSNSSPSVQRLTWSDASSANRKTLQLSFAGLPDEVVLQETHIGYVTKEPFAEAFSQQGAHGRPNNSEAGEDFLERDSASENDIHSCSKSVIHIGSQSFLKASTALKEGAFKYHGYPSTVTSLPSLSVEEMNPDTPIQSVSRAMCSYESALCTPEEGNAFRTTLHDDSINDKARVQLANRFHVRRVHSNFRTKAGTNPLGGSTVSEPSRTEQWVQQATPVPVANQPHQAGQVQQTADSRLSPDGVPPSGSDYYSPSDVSQNTEGSSPLRRRSSLTGSVADTRRRSREATGIERPPSRPTARAASPAGSEGYAPSSASGGLAAPIYRPGGMGGSLSDLRQTADRPRLSSEAGSVSSLSVASKEPAEGTNSDSAHASPSSSSITRKIEDVPVPEPLQRKSRTLTREEFSEMFGKPLDALAGPDHRRQMTGSLRSLRHVFPVRYRRDERRHGSMLSIYSEKESSYTHGIPVTGDLRLDIQYDKATQTLKIGVKEARDLAIVDKKHQSCNPYVKSYLLPDKTKASKRKTSTKRHTRNPTYEQELKYGIPYGDLLTRSLQIAVWHKPSVGTNLFLGEVIIPFTDFQFDTGPQWYPLSERRQLTVSPQAALQLYRGEILVALKLVPGGLMDTQSELHVWVKSAKGLTTSGSGRSKSVTVDAFAKVSVVRSYT